MEYQKQNFVNDETVLTAEMLEHIENGIVALCTVVEKLCENIGGSVPTARIGYITLFADKWVGGGSPYSQIVAVDKVTENSQVDITPSVEQLAIFHEKDLTFVTENEGGVVTVYAVGQKPTNDYTLQVTITEVSV